MFGLRIVDAVARQDWLGRLSEGTQRVVQQVYGAGGRAGEQVANLLHGTPVGHPLHPLFSDFPVGAWTSALVLDLLDTLGGRDDLAPGADTAVGIGLVAALAAIPTGITDWKELDTKPLRVGMLHGVFNLSATTLYGVSLLLRKRGDREAGRAVSYIGFGLVVLAGYLGGDLVFRDQIGVNHATPVWTPLKWAPALADAELGEGAMRRVKIGDRQILVVRSNGQVYAMEAACSHLGGPLEDGALEDGCVVCPWHGSRFRLDNGEPVDGPAVIPQPCYETRIRDGQIEVRAGQ